MLINLIANALKFTFQGSITVKVGFDSDSYELSVNVKDTGIGIRKEDKQKLFRMFGKLEDTANMNTTGIGLGLSICKNILNNLGGKIYLDSDNEIGTSIIFTLKCEAPLERFNPLIS